MTSGINIGTSNLKANPNVITSHTSFLSDAIDGDEGKEGEGEVASVLVIILY